VTLPSDSQKGASDTLFRHFLEEMAEKGNNDPFPCPVSLF